LDNIDVFVNHFVIHSKSRDALILNSSTVEYFEGQLRELILAEIKDTLMERVKHYERQREKVPSAGLERYDRLTDARDTLKDLHDDIEFWGDKYDERKETS